MPTMRLDRLISTLAYGSRREASNFVRDGRIALDGVVIAKPDQAIDLEAVRQGRLTFDGVAFDPPPPLTLMLHKPAGYSCSHDDRGELIYQLLPARWQRRSPALAAAGRLDKDSTGQVILTDDGAFLHRITHPRMHAPKYYEVTLAQPLRGDEAALFATGSFLMQSDPKPLKPASWTPLTPTSGQMVLEEGRYHQIKLMFATLNNAVVGLHRTRTGELELGELAVGHYRILSVADCRLILPPPI